MKLMQQQRRHSGDTEEDLWEQPWPLPRRGPPSEDDEDDSGSTEGD